VPITDPELRRQYHRAYARKIDPELRREYQRRFYAIHQPAMVEKSRRYRAWRRALAVAAYSWVA
jgi:hypothetical protein